MSNWIKQFKSNDSYCRFKLKQRRSAFVESARNRLLAAGLKLTHKNITTRDVFSTKSAESSYLAVMHCFYDDESTVGSARPSLNGEKQVYT